MPRLQLSPEAGRTLLAIGRALTLALLLPELVMAFQWASAAAPLAATTPAAVAIATFAIAINPDVWVFVALFVLFSRGSLASEASARREVLRSPVPPSLRRLRDACAVNGAWRTVSAAYAASIACDATAQQRGMENSTPLAGAGTVVYALHPATLLWLQLRGADSGAACKQAFPACLPPVLALDVAQAAVAIAVAIVLWGMVAPRPRSQS